MIEGGEDLRFPFEPREAVGVVDEGLGQDLQSDLAPQRRIVRSIHLSHPARTECGEDFVRTEVRANRERHTYFAGTRCFSSSNQGRKSLAIMPEPSQERVR